MRIELRFCPERGWGREEFEISAQGDCVALAASTAAAMGHAVHYFLEQAFGVRYFLDGIGGLGDHDAGTVCLPAVDADWPPGVTRHRPAWTWRRLWLGGAFYGASDPRLAEMQFGGAPGDLGGAGTLAAAQPAGRSGNRGRTPLVPDLPAGVHGRAHPEYFALVNGARGYGVPGTASMATSPCTSNPAVVCLTAEYVMAQFRARSNWTPSASA